MSTATHDDSDGTGYCRGCGTTIGELHHAGCDVQPPAVGGRVERIVILRGHMRYKWNKKDGLCDENGRQLIQFCATGASKKFRDMAGKVLANQLNNMELGKEAAKQHNAPLEG